MSERMDYDRWEDLYEPRSDAEGCLLRDTEPDHLTPNAHLWTLLDAEGEQLLVPGYHRVNRIGYVVTELPHDDGPLEVLWPTVEPEPTDCPTCGHDNENHNPFCERCDALLPINEDRHV